MSFENIIGHENIKAQVIRSIENSKFAHAHLLVGEDGIGKSILAENMAMKILGKVREIDYPDIVKWKVPKNRKSIGVEQVRELTEEINRKPYEGDKKVIIVYEAHKMTIQAQNAFLKTIEEPPKGVFIILLCENLEVLLDTIKSRCQIHKLKSLTEEEIYKYLKRKYNNLSEDKIKSVIAFSNGIPGRAEKFLDDKIFNEIRDKTIDIFTNITKVNELKALEYDSFFLEFKESWEEILNCMLVYIRDAMIYKETSNKELIINKDKYKEIEEITRIFSFKKLNDIIDIIKEAIDSLNKNVNLALVFDVMLLKIQEV
ncbi:DNA polymerase III subunit delta' [Haloimpatiens sp. FM7330]|uniref:DNA polymerase III subunit delta' n=1 Tax=Haloimpatiens sp. FM7330 TaxID=3298610 RepID=UPI003630EFAB